MSVAAVGIASIVASMLGVRWGILPLLVVVVVLALIAALGGRFTRRWRVAVLDRGELISGNAWVALLAVPVAALVIGFWTLHGFGAPDAFNQTWDNVFHLSAIQYILENGDASSLTILSMTWNEGPYGFYPATWHALASLVAEVTGASPMVAANATNLVIASLVWPLSATALTLTLLRPGVKTALVAGLVFAGFSGFPYLLLEYGVLYPNFLSYALIPAVLALLAAFLGVGTYRLTTTFRGLGLGLMGLVGVALAHPNGGMLVAAIALVPIGFVAFRVGVPLWRARRWGRLALLGAAAVCLLLVYCVAWGKLRPAEGWPPVEQVPQAVGELIFQSGYARPAAWGISVLAVVGAVTLVRRRSPSSWLVGGWALVGVLFVIVASVDSERLRWFTGVWFNNTPRLAAALPLVVAPVAVYGAQVTWRWIRTRLPRETPRSRVLLVGALCAALLVATVVRTAQSSSGWIASLMRVVDDARALNPDEFALIERLPDTVGDDALLAVNPFYGGSFAYPLVGVDVTWHHLGHGPDADVDLIDFGLSTAEPGDEVCQAVIDSGVTHVLDFSGNPMAPNNPNAELPGLENLADSDVVELVDSQGDAKLWAITGCG
ncbi:hypothetical protein EDD28_0311 [Salana multivorans]|uniref:4-amino-4-deoxy-L-arabinose transferase-like glycosyltransferase n=1 Tax=Salana multivorans TaxID=120377 RepID=A0A3N2D7I2_9MICO|nr:DUF6541 family protein [Salana multivorans]ROR95749.1 hypothetical protein EDD28_0311 [Salana multivorans]